MKAQRPCKVDPLRTDFKVKSWLSNSKGNISTTTSSITTIDTLLERSFHCASNRGIYNVKPSQTRKLHCPEWRKLRVVNPKRNPIVLGLWSNYEDRFSRVNSLSSCRHLVYTFRDVSSYHGKAVSDVAAHACGLLDCENRPKSKSLVTSNGCGDIISCPIFKTEISTFWSRRDLSNDTLFVEIRWEIVTQWLSKLYRSPAIDFWLGRP